MTAVLGRHSPPLEDEGEREVVVAWIDAAAAAALDHFEVVVVGDGVATASAHDVAAAGAACIAAHAAYACGSAAAATGGVAVGALGIEAEPSAAPPVGKMVGSMVVHAHVDQRHGVSTWTRLMSLGLLLGLSGCVDKEAECKALIASVGQANTVMGSHPGGASSAEMKAYYDRVLAARRALSEVSLEDDELATLREAEVRHISELIYARKDMMRARVPSELAAAEGKFEKAVSAHVATVTAMLECCSAPGAIAPTMAASPSTTSTSGTSAPVEMTESAPPSVTLDPTASAAPEPKPAKPAANAPFIHKPQGGYGHPVDACLPHGGVYFSCSSAYAGEKDEVQKRYLHRVASGQVAGMKDYASSAPPIQSGEIAHAEVPAMCDPTKACGATAPDVIDGTLNDVHSCLARTFEAVLMHDRAAARAAHAKACQCDTEHHGFIAYNTSAYICAQGKPAFLAPGMSKEEGDDIYACASCDPAQGPAACQREIRRLEASDPPVADYVKRVQIPRCQSKAPNPEN